MKPDTSALFRALQQKLQSFGVLPPTRPKVVLVVDDEPTITKMVVTFLNKEGYVAVSASDGVEAMKVFQTLGHCDLLVTDLRMPNMDGEELYLRLHMLHPDLRVLYLTGHVDGLFTHRSLLWPEEAYLAKPFAFDKLRDAVQLAMDGNPHLSPTA